MGALGSMLGMSAAPAAGAAGNAAQMASLGMGPQFESAMAGGITPAMAGTGTVGGASALSTAMPYVGAGLMANQALGNPLGNALGLGQPQRGPQVTPHQASPLQVTPTPSPPQIKPATPALTLGQIPLY